MPINNTVKIINDFKLLKFNRSLYSTEQYLLELEILKYRLNDLYSNVSISENQMNTLLTVLEET